MVQEAKDVLVISVTRVDGPLFGQKASAKIEKSLKGQVRQPQIELPFFYHMWPQGSQMVGTTPPSKDIVFAHGKRYLVLIQKTNLQARKSGNPNLAKTTYEVIPIHQDGQNTFFDLSSNDFILSETADLLKISSERNSGAKVKMLTAMLASSNASVRADAADALADFNTKEIGELLLKTLKSDSNPTVRARIVRRLQAYSGDQVTQTLINTAKLDQVPGVREAAIISLSKRGSKDAVPALLALFPNSNDHFKSVILTALQALPDANALPSLINFFNSSKDVRIKAEILDAVSTIPTLDAPRFCIRVLDSKESIPVKMAAVHAIGVSGFSEFFPKLTEYISHPCSGSNTPFELLLIDALYKLGKPEMVLPVLRDYLSCSDTEIRKRSVLLMGALKLKSAIPILQGQLRSETNPAVKTDIVKVIGKLKSSGR
ncbi:MAG: HEAT repeat domain-containing protein [Chlorobiales bacterium]|nr:HEAT repeat domain-containing protein [Chlorobiales bacterium]